MTCPRCSQPLSTLSFDGRAARYCERCGFVGVETVHERDAPSRESWDDAIARFHERAVREARERDGDVGGGDAGDGPAEGDDAAESERAEADADADRDEADATESDDGGADDGVASDGEPSDYLRKNGEDGDRGDRAGDE
ncbi:zinc finger domain-containing protein [Haloferax sp. KTX1]|uniref:zinc finger domain-containing protein n=1 Tax=Haloferax sp. KTX1 TaxID=2600597 RepID=UPI0011DE10B9|nr:zinc finger domain-containing protein [Haloferax sp. KTX1]